MKTLAITFKDYSEKVITVNDCGMCLSMSIARGLIKDNKNIIRVVVSDEIDGVIGVADRD